MIISAGKSNKGVGQQLERNPGIPYWTAAFFLSGLTEIDCVKETLIFPPRSCVILAPGTSYRLRVLKTQQEIWMIFDARMRLHQMLPLADSAFPAIPIVFQNPELWREVQAALRDLLRWWGSQPPQLLLAENAMERALLLSAREHGLQNQPMSDDRVQRAVAYIENRLGQDLSVATMAGAAGLSPTRFAHLFREMIGLAPMKFLELKRIERAKHLLLTTDIPIQQIGRDNGYPNAQHFSIRFRKVTGQSPSDFREAPKRRSGELETKPN